MHWVFNREPAGFFKWLSQPSALVGQFFGCLHMFMHYLHMHLQTCIKGERGGERDEGRGRDGGGKGCRQPFTAESYFFPR